MERKIVTPGEVIVSEEGYLPGRETEKKGKDIVSLRFGLAEESEKIIRVIPLSGGYSPRRGNTIIGRVEMITFRGWVIDIGKSENAFLPLTEVPRYVNKGELEEVMKIGDMVVAKINSSNPKSLDLTIKSRGLGKIKEGMVFNINPSKVPRVIGKEGSMIKLIKDRTNCNVTVGQNGFILAKGEKIEDELLARKAIEFIVEKSFVEGLTEEMEKWFEDKSEISKSSSLPEESQTEEKLGDKNE